MYPSEFSLTPYCRTRFKKVMSITYLLHITPYHYNLFWVHPCPPWQIWGPSCVPRGRLNLVDMPDEVQICEAIYALQSALIDRLFPSTPTHVATSVDHEYSVGKSDRSSRGNFRYAQVAITKYEGQENQMPLLVCVTGRLPPTVCWNCTLCKGFSNPIAYQNTGCGFETLWYVLGGLHRSYHR